MQHCIASHATYRCDLLHDNVESVVAVFHLKQFARHVGAVYEGAGDHLEGDAAERPDVTALVTRPLENLGSHPVHRAYEQRNRAEAVRCCVHIRREGQLLTVEVSTKVQRTVDCQEPVL